MMNNDTNKLLFAPYFEPPENSPFVIKIGGTTYEVTSHFTTDGKENVLEQFMDLILEENII